MQANKGVYALLLGSGISRSAGIPTGWEIVLDLIQKLAHVNNDGEISDPIEWYKGKFQEEPNYSKILDVVAKTPAERSQLLRGYFEPTEDEKAQGLKVPTEAHKAIADLIASNHIKLIVTTNFDRLLEKALEDKGIVPTVISTSDAVDGALPLIHARCTIVKVHGDYLDVRIKNTPDEVAVYDQQINELLDRILDEFGLIICGWSADWDIAMRAAIERCKGQRFTTYWTVRDNLSDVAKKLIDFRRAQVIKIADAGQFFREVQEKVAALDEFSRPHPLSAKMAVATFKRYLEEEKYKIRLHDLVMQETENVLAKAGPDNFPIQGVAFTPEELLRRTKHYETLLEVLQAMAITGAYWGTPAQEYLWIKAFERLTDCLSDTTGTVVWVNLRLYPALILLYSMGIAALAANNFSTFAAILTKPQNRHGRPTSRLLLTLYPGEVMEQGVAQKLPGLERRYTPVNDHLAEVLYPALKEILPNRDTFEDSFDEFEYVHSLVFMDMYSNLTNRSWSPVGRFSWRNKNSPEEHIANKIGQSIAAAGQNWPLLRVGLFGGSLDRLQTIRGDLDQRIARSGWD